jgi:hypothetical protein
MATPFTVKIEYLRSLFDRLALFVAKDETRPVLTVIKLKAEKEGLTGVAADGFILAHQRIGYARPPQAFGAELLIPPTHVRAFLKTCGRKEGPIGLIMEEKRLVVIVPPAGSERTPKIIKHGSKLPIIDPGPPLVGAFPSIEGNFPKYENLKPEGDFRAVVSLAPDLLAKVAQATKKGSHPEAYGMLHIGILPGGGAAPIVMAVEGGFHDEDDRFWALVMPMFTKPAKRLEDLGRAMAKKPKGSRKKKGAKDAKAR